MFTGIVREIAEVTAVEARQGGARLRVRAPRTAAVTRTGDSISVNGVCLTATTVRDGLVEFDAVPETLARSTLGRLQGGAAVNLEPAVRAGEPLGGHIVQGHVDAVGRVRAIVPEGEGKRLVLEVPPAIERLCVEKGSLTVEGVSLTVAALVPGAVEIALVPHTLAATTLGGLAAGDEVNLEADLVAKHVARLVEERGHPA